MPHPSAGNKKRRRGRGRRRARPADHRKADDLRHLNRDGPKTRCRGRPGLMREAVDLSTVRVRLRGWAGGDFPSLVRGPADVSQKLFQRRRRRGSRVRPRALRPVRSEERREIEAAIASVGAPRVLVPASRRAPRARTFGFRPARSQRWARRPAHARGCDHQIDRQHAAVVTSAAAESTARGGRRVRCGRRAVVSEGRGGREGERGTVPRDSSVPRRRNASQRAARNSRRHSPPSP